MSTTTGLINALTRLFNALTRLTKASTHLFGAATTAAWTLERLLQIAQQSGLLPPA